MNRILISLLALAVSACASSRAQEAGPAPDAASMQAVRTLVYECLGTGFIARTGPGEIALWLEDRYVILSRVRSASGAKYEEGDIVFWSKGEVATLTVAGQRYPECKLVPARVPWEDARRRAVDFRAAGNEPGWSLEIKNGQQLLFVLDQGMQRVMLPDPGFQVTADGRVYHAVSETDDLVIDIVDSECRESPVGEVFPSQVSVTWNGHMLSGCGMPLDHPWE